MYKLLQPILKLFKLCRLWCLGCLGVGYGDLFPSHHTIVRDFNYSKNFFFKLAVNIHSSLLIFSINSIREIRCYL